MTDATMPAGGATGATPTGQGFTARRAADGRPVDVPAALDKFLGMIGAHAAAYMDACVHCGQCAQACHFHEVTQNPRYTPAYKFVPLARAYRRYKSPFSGLWRMLGAARQITEDDLRDWEELLFDTCTMCSRCTVVCPMGIDTASLVAASRQAFVAAGLGPEDLLAAAENSRDTGSPLGVTDEKFRERVEWLADEYEIDIPLGKDKADVLVTISSIETMKYPASIVAIAKLLNRAGVDWTLSTTGHEATNFGYLAGRMDIARITLERVVDAAEKIGARIVVIPECGHGYGVLRWSGANILGRELPFEPLHITEYLARLKYQGKLKFKPMSRSLTYHDPCQISRRGGATWAARYLLQGFAEDFREMEPTGNYNWCCGGGGGVQAVASAADVRHKVFGLKISQVEKAGAEILVSACANCRLTMDESREYWNWDHEIDSLVEILADHLAEEAEFPK